MLPQTIVYIQQTLNKLGYGPLDEGGVYSNSVRLAISRFEKDRRMHPTGEIDAALVRELGRASGVPLE
jgi:peptidoglycan hydrolase-like protein with peptidoglycan-binding domain